MSIIKCKVTSRRARAFLDSFDEINEKVIDWLLASWERGLGKTEKKFARNKYLELADKRKRFLEKWKNL